MNDKIHQILQKKFTPDFLQAINESALHAGHPEAQQAGGGHFTVKIVSTKFQGLKPLERHRLIYQALYAELRGQIHALSIKAYAPDEKF